MTVWETGKQPVVTLVAKRVASMLLTILLLSLLTFLLPYLSPGDPGVLILRARMGGTLPASREAVEVLKEEMGLNLPPHIIYGRWLSGALRGDLGHSYVTRQPAAQTLREALIATAQLGLFAGVLIVAIGLPLGTTCARRPNAPLDRLSSVLASVSVSIPAYVASLVAILLFAVTWRLLPAAGRGTLSHLVLPGLSVAVPGIAAAFRLTRYNMMEEMGREHVAVARSKGLAEGTVRRRHILRNAAPPLVTYFGLQMGWLLSGTVIVESIFGWPGMGRLLVDSVLSFDIPVVQGSVLLIGTLFVGINFATDLLCLHLDPTLRPEGMI